MDTNRNIDLKEIINLIEQIKNRCISQVEKLRFGKKHPQHLILISLYGSILELADGCIILLKTQRYTGFPILLRSLFEGYIDLINLVKNKHYFRNMNATYLNERLRVLRHAYENKANPYLKDISNKKDLKETIDDIKAELKELEKKGFKPLSIFEKFKLAKLINEYQSIYAELCLDTHNNIRALEERHIEPISGDFNVIFNKSIKYNDIMHFIDLLVFTIVDSSKQIWNFFGMSVDQDQDKIKKSFNEFRQKYIFPDSK